MAVILIVPMKTSFRPAAAILTVALSCFFLLLNSRAADLYYFLKEIPVKGEGGWDYLSADSAGRRLYVAHSTKIVVIDMDKDEVAGQITGTPGVHGFAIAPELNRGFSSNGREANASIVDLKTLKTIGKVSTGENPDCILYEPGLQEVYAFNGKSKSVTIFGAASGKVAATVPLPGKPEFAVADPKAGRVYCNIEDKNEIVVIDTSSHAITNTWSIAPGEEASGLAIDPAHGRLFAGCHNKMMVMLDSATGKFAGSVPIGTGVDANAFDPGTQFAFSSCGDGTTTIAREDSPEKLSVAQNLPTHRGARTMALDLKTHKIYMAAAEYEAQPDPEPGQRAKRPRMIPNTFKILVYGMDNAGH